MTSSNAVTAVRTRCKQVLVTAGLSAFAEVPEVVTPPCVWVAPNEPYLTRPEGVSFRSRVVNLSLVLAVEPGGNDVQFQDLEDLVLQVCDVLDDDRGDADGDGRFFVGDVGSVGSVSINKQLHLGCAISVTSEIDR